MHRSPDEEESVDDMDGNDWARRFTHSEAEPEGLDPTEAAIHEDSIGDGYVENWANISAEVRRKRNWTCQDCHIRLWDRTRLLEVHHIDRDKTNNDENNLRVLCALCHGARPSHEHLLRSISAEDERFIMQRRNEIKDC